MNVLISKDWIDYELLDCGSGEKLERWGEYTLIRPDPQIIWETDKNKTIWKNADAHYFRSAKGGGNWEYKKKLPDRWTISYKNLKFYVQPTEFKHMGLFPEQAINWDFITEKIAFANRKIRVLNLFAYTGGATIAAAAAGAEVCHIDAAKGMISWAKENAELSGVNKTNLRFIADDVIKFVEREKRRGSFYDAIIMDPPSYGRGPNGEVWRLEDNLYTLLKSCSEILTDKPLFFLLNSYTTGFSPIVGENMVKSILNNRFNGNNSVESGEIGLAATGSEMVLPCGLYVRWEHEK